MPAKGSKTAALISLIVFALVFAFLPVGSARGDSSSPVVEWSLEAELLVPVDGGVDHMSALTSKLNANNARSDARVIASDERGVTYAFKASGKSDVNALRSVLYTAAAPGFRLLGGVTEMEVRGRALGKQNTTIILESNPSTGYGWRLSPGSAVTRSAPDRYEHARGYGASQRQILLLTSDATGEAPIKLVYKRSWEDRVPTRSLKLSFPLLPEKLDLSNPDTPVAPVVAEEDRVQESAFPALSVDLPSHFDWRESGIVPAVRDQGYCGSCWAFGTVGIMESALWKNGVADVDLSEQFLLSCNKDKWNCESGGFTAHKYHYNTTGQKQKTVGAVLEAAKPYTATDGTCGTTDYNKSFRLTGWKFITGSEKTVATVEQIKNAIYTYGPVTAGVCAGSGWDDYAGGVFSTDETSECCDPGEKGCTNHQIILVGWDDEEQYWILRNSWGEGWGIDGYMHIRYDISRVGEGTSWVTTKGTLTPSIVIDSPTLPDGEVKVAYVTATMSVVNGTGPYKWAAAPGSAVPAGLKLKTGKDTSIVTISGTPSKAGSYSFTVRVTDKDQRSEDQALTVVVYPVLAVSPDKLPNAVVGTAYTQALAVTGGSGAGYQYSTVGKTPSWLTVSSEGVIAGTPTTAGSCQVSVRVTDSLGGSVMKRYTIKVAKAPAAL